MTAEFLLQATITSMTASNCFDSKTILDGIRRWVEIETPTEAPEQIDKLATLVAEGYRDLPAVVERIAGRNGCGDHLVARSSWGQDAPGILVLSHLDTVHPMGFINRLPFRIEGDSAFGPGIYDMKGGAYLAYHAFRQLCAATEHPLLGVTQLYVSDEGRSPPRSASISWVHPPAAAPMATSPRRIRERSTVSALMARARTPTMSRSPFRRSSRGRGCCIGCIRP